MCAAEFKLKIIRKKKQIFKKNQNSMSKHKKCKSIFILLKRLHLIERNISDSSCVVIALVFSFNSKKIEEKTIGI